MFIKRDKKVELNLIDSNGVSSRKGRRARREEKKQQIGLERETSGRQENCTI